MSAPAGPPRATYRLQFNHTFTFRDAIALVDYLAELGISHLYASPFLKARAGSTHGYDITDHNELNPEIGSEADFAALVAALHAHGMGLILDFVPNHMGVGGHENRWWLDVLEWGETSPYAAFFDIDWHAGRRDLTGKVLLPVLGDQYGIVLEKGEIALRFDADEGSFSAWYYEHRSPIDPRSYPAILRRMAVDDLAPADAEALQALLARAEQLSIARRRADRRDEATALKTELRALAARPSPRAAIDAAAATFAGRPDVPRSWRALHSLLEAQSYRLAYWRVAADEINYRRFFNINDLAGIRIELPALFEAAHRLVLSLIARGCIQGLRIDHIDGLADPREYCERLQHAASSCSPTGEPFYIVVEKILARYESLPSWPIAGMTGYEFTNQVAGLFIDGEVERRFTRLYTSVTGRHGGFDEILHASKMRITGVNLASEINVLAQGFHEFALADRRTRDFTLNGMRSALCEVLAAFPVYRTYVGRDGASAEDIHFIDWAVAVAKRRSPAVDTTIFDFIRTILTGEVNGHREDAVRLAVRFQQVSGPVMAKGLEDTSFYRYVRLLALNEVGSDPRRFGVSAAALHRFNEERAQRWPHTMLTTATHDTKRGEDARMRLAVLSEMPEEWRRRVAIWLRLNRLKRGEIDGAAVPVRNDEYFFYQTMVGAWPLDLDPGDAGAVAAFAERINGTMIKAVREGKEQSSWGNPHAAYEAALTRFVTSALDASRANPFLTDLVAFVERIARFAALNSLAQTTLKLTFPGVPDIYQGCELWDFSLVDPDNRRPVDFAVRGRLLSQLRAAFAEPNGDRLSALLRDWRDGREKLFLTWRLLAWRAEQPELFANSAYTPLTVSGERAAHAFAFLRTHGGKTVAVIVPRLVARLCGESGTADWGNTAVTLPPAQGWRNVITGQRHDGDAGVALARLLDRFPVSVLVAD
jgi:(1->4)-alpha-D-glucan 1-alpha-D-glucosylmutase